MLTFKYKEYIIKEKNKNKESEENIMYRIIKRTWVDGIPTDTIEVEGIKTKKAATKQFWELVEDARKNPRGIGYHIEEV